jgi:Protein of unknown function (DUF2637)
LKEANSSTASRARGWPYVVTGALFAGIAAWISYNDGLFVTRLAGNDGMIVFAYPLLPDGLIVLCLLALMEAARAGVARSRWAVAGLVLGACLTLAMNTGAGVAHSPLDAVIDAMVPVVFYIAAEVVLWHVRRARAVPLPVPEPVPVRKRLPSVREIRERASCSQATAEKIRAELAAFARDRGGSPSVPRAAVPVTPPPSVPSRPGEQPAASSNGQVRP